jgi:CheY-like chemotaxis protein
VQPVLGAAWKAGDFASRGLEQFDPSTTASLAAVVLVALSLLYLGMQRLPRSRRRRASQATPHHTRAADVGSRAQQLATDETRRGSPEALGWTTDRMSPAASATASRAADGRKKTILIADDDPVVMLALTQRLQHLGYDVFRSPDAAHALLGVLKCYPDLVILDVTMPSGNGLAVCEMMASDARYAKIPVIIHSGFADEATKARCLSLGAHHVEKSPQSWAQIRQLIETLIGNDRQAPPADDSASPAAADAARPIAASVAAANTDNATCPVADGGHGPQSAEPETSDAIGQTSAPPAHPAPSDDACATAMPRTSPVCGGCRIICVESPADRLALVDHQLTALGMAVVRTSDLEEGYWTCFTERPQAVIVQAAVQTKQLRALLERLAQHPVTRALPVLLINEDNRISVQEAARYPNLSILTSPMDWEDLLGRLAVFTPMFSGSDDDPLMRGGSPPNADSSSDALTGDDSADSPTADQLKPPTILCIDDDPITTRSIAIRLQPYGITVLTADNGTQGYLTATVQHPDLILLDLHIPNGDGNYVIGKLRANPQTEAIPIIVLTMETHPGVHRTVLANGAHSVLCKPIRWRELFMALERCVPLPKRLLADYKFLEEATA